MAEAAPGSLAVFSPSMEVSSGGRAMPGAIIEARSASIVNDALHYDVQILSPELFNFNQFLVAAGKVTFAHGKGVAIFRFFYLCAARAEFNF
jgi:hypothetical protein